MVTAHRQTRSSQQAEASRNLRKITCAVEVKGGNQFDEVQSGTLVSTGYMRTAILNYMDDWVKDSGQDVRKEHNPLMYRLSIDQLYLPFYADYILSGEGKDNVPDNAEIFLLEVFPNICLVLKNTWQAHIFNRIGIFKTTTEFEQNYRTNIMSKGMECRVIIY